MTAPEGGVTSTMTGGAPSSGQSVGGSQRYAVVTDGETMALPPETNATFVRKPEPPDSDERPVKTKTRDAAASPSSGSSSCDAAKVPGFPDGSTLRVAASAASGAPAVTLTEPAIPSPSPSAPRR